MPTFSDFDTRGYRMVDARTGYGEWVATYEGTVEDVHGADSRRFLAVLLCLRS